MMLTPKLEKIIQTSIDNGYCKDFDEFIRNASCFMETDGYQIFRKKLNELRTSLNKSINQIEKGECTIVEGHEELKSYFKDIRQRAEIRKK